MGVSHRGSALADLGSMFATVLKIVMVGGSTNNALLKTLKKASKPLQDISELVVDRLSVLTICSFYETKRINGQVVRKLTTVY